MSSQSPDRAQIHNRSYPELLRCVFCSLVVLGHARPASINAAILAVVGFLTISTTFTIDASNSPRLRARIREVLFLWLAWCVPYAVVLVVRSIIKGNDPLALARPSMLLTGPSIHLWYLPALAATSGMLLLLGERVHWKSVAWLSAVVAGLIAAVSMTGLSMSDPPAPQMLVAGFGLATAIGTCRILPRSGSRAWAALGLLAIIAAVALCLVTTHVWLNYFLVALGTICLCRAPQPAPPHWLVAVASLTGGIYLVHAMVIFPLRYVGVSGLPLFVAALFISGVVTAIARQTQLRRFFP